MIRRLTLVMPVLVVALNFATTAAAQNGPYYATPSWDQQLQCDTTATCPRFIVLSNWGNAAVLDRETGLVWQRDPTPTASLPWADAVTNTCFFSTTGGRAGWRLPTAAELSTLTLGFFNLPAGHPFGPATGNYWSATTSAIDTTQAMAWGVVDPNAPGFAVTGSDGKTAPHGVWCVRSAAPGFVGQ